MPSLMELVERVNKGELVDSDQLEIYQESANSAEKFLAHHAHAMLDLRCSQQHMLQCLEAIDYSDQKVLNQFVSISGFLGMTDLRCGPIVKFGSCAMQRREYGLGLEAIQNAVAYDLAHNGAYTADRENCMFVAMQYDRAAQCIAWTNPLSSEWNNKQTRMAYLVSSICDDDASARGMLSMAKHCDSKRFKLSVYSTECSVRRDRQQFAQASYVSASGKRGGQTMDSLKKMKVESWCAPTDCDLVTSAKELANQLVKDRIDVLVCDCTQADAIAAMIAQWDCCRVKINLCRRNPMYMSGINSVCYVDQVRYDMDKDFWTRKNVDSKFILEGVDLETDMGPPAQRGTYGIPETACVLATAGSDLDKTMSDEFCDTVINLLRSHPHCIYLVIGEGEMAQQKRKFDSAGVGKRVGYAGKRKDMPGFLRICDVYLSEFPCSGATGVLQAMSCERPVVAMRCGDSTDQCQAAALVGSEATISGRDANAYVERVCKMIRDAGYRQQLGKSMHSRVQQHFSYGQTCRHLEQLCDQLMQQRMSGSMEMKQIPRMNLDEPMAQVA